jgi:hypothetical protein
MAISYPPIFINDYLRERFSDLIGPDGVSVDVPFFPTSPSTIEQLTQTATINNTGNLFAVYDRMFKMRRRQLPHIKDEQLLYYFYSLDIPVMVDAVQYAADLLDRGDESAQDLNAWIQGKLENGLYIKPDGNTTKEFLPVKFHDIRIWQLEESRDIIDFGTARTYAGNKIIIDYCYHTIGYPRGNPVENFDRARPRYDDANNSSYNDTTI